MSEKEESVTVKIPNLFAELIDKYIELHKKEMMFSGHRVSRATVVKKALYEFLKKEGIITK